MEMKQRIIEFKDKLLNKKMESNISLEEATEPIKFLRGLCWLKGGVY